MGKIKTFSDNEMTVIYDPNAEANHAVGAMIRGDQMIYKLVKCKDESLEETLDRNTKDTDHTGFIYTLPDGEKVVAYTGFTASDSPQAISVDKVIAGNFLDDMNIDQEFSESIIRELKKYMDTYRRGATNKDIKEIRPDAGPSDSSGGRKL